MTSIFLGPENNRKTTGRRKSDPTDTLNTDRERERERERERGGGERGEGSEGERKCRIQTIV